MGVAPAVTSRATRESGWTRWTRHLSMDVKLEKEVAVAAWAPEVQQAVLVPEAWRVASAPEAQQAARAPEAQQAAWAPEARQAAVVQVVRAVR